MTLLSRICTECGEYVRPSSNAVTIGSMHKRCLKRFDRRVESYHEYLRRKGYES